MQKENVPRPTPLPRALKQMFIRQDNPLMDALGDGEEEELWPRDEANRFRIYAVKGQPKKGLKPEMEVLATAATPGGIGEAIIAIHEQQREEGRRLADLGRIGVLDVMPDRQPSAYGEWVVLPFDRQFT